MQTPRKWPVLTMPHTTIALGLLGAVLLISLGINSIGIEGVALYPFYLLLIAGYGIKYGVRYLVVATLLSSLCLYTVLHTNNFWSENPVVGLSFITGLIIFPIYYWQLVNRLHRTNRELEQALVKAAHNANHDSLTGVANRACLYQKVEEHLQIAKRTGEKFGILFIDLDNFKQVNDYYGHDCGDQVLQKTAEVLSHSAREYDLVARLGGDEFAILVHGVSQQAILETISDRILTGICQLSDQLCSASELSVSIGISIFPNHGETVEELIKIADQAMYRAKYGGKNSYFLPEMEAEAVSG